MLLLWFVSLKVLPCVPQHVGIISGILYYKYRRKNIVNFLVECCELDCINLEQCQLVLCSLELFFSKDRKLPEGCNNVRSVHISFQQRVVCCKALLSMSNCGSHFAILTFLGCPGKVSASHFQRTRCGSSENACMNASLLLAGRVSVRIIEPMLKYMTPCSASFR